MFDGDGLQGAIGRADENGELAGEGLGLGLAAAEEERGKVDEEENKWNHGPGAAWRN